MTPEFFGKTVPLAGQQKPAPKRYMRRWQGFHTLKVERLNDGRWLLTEWMDNRCGNSVQSGSNSVCVVDNYGDYVEVANWGPAWR